MARGARQAKVPERVQQQAKQLAEKLHIPLIEYEIEKRPVDLAKIMKETVDTLLADNAVKINPVDAVKVIREFLSSIIHIEKKDLVTYELLTEKIDIARVIKDTMEQLIEDNSVVITPKEVINDVAVTNYVDIARVIETALQVILKEQKIKIEPSTRYRTIEETTIKYNPVIEDLKIAQIVQKALDDLIFKNMITTEKVNVRKIDVDVFKLHLICPHCNGKFSLGGTKE